MKNHTRALAIPIARQVQVRVAVVQKPRPRARLGRPTKLTPSVQRQICTAIEAGNYIEIAAELAGVGRSTVFRWLALADGGDPEIQDFRDAVQKARARAEARAVAAIRKAGRRAWQANAWYLERSFPDRWARRERLAQFDVVRPGVEDAPPDSRAAERVSDVLRRDPNKIPQTLRALDQLARALADDPAQDTALPEGDALDAIGSGSADPATRYSPGL